MNKDTIIKVLLAIIALMVFAWLWRIISGMIIGTLVLTTSLLSVLIALIIQIVLPIAVIVNLDDGVLVHDFSSFLFIIPDFSGIASLA